IAGKCRYLKWVSYSITNPQQFIGKREIDYIPPQGESKVSVLWQTPRGKAGNKILVEAHPADGEEHSYDNHAVKTLWISIEAENFPVAIDSAISSRTYRASAPILSDLDGDGDTELVVQGELSGGSYFYICAWHYDGALVEGFPVSILAANRYGKEKIELFPVVGDVDSDGYAEIACTFRTRKVYLLHHDGRIAEGFPVQLRAFAASSPVLYDIDGDGRLEIIVALTNGEVDVLRGDGTQLDGFPAFIHSGSETAFVPPTVAVGDVDGDGQPEIVVSLLQLDGSLGEYAILEHDGSRVGSSLIEVPHTSLFPPSLGDLDNDSHAEIVVVSEEKNIYVLNHKGILIAGFPTRTKREITSSPVLGDINGDGSLEIVTTTLDYVHAWHRDGTNVNGFPIYVRGRNSYPVLVDMDGDGRNEIIFSNNGIRAYHHDGSPIDGFPIEFRNSKVSAPALADVDGDGYLEIGITSSREIHLMDDAGIYSPKHIEWGAALHDTWNTNSYSARTALRMPGIYLDSMQRNGSIVLSWRKELDQADVSFYRILRADFPTGTFSTLAKVGTGESTYVDNTATVDVVYWYRIIAEDRTNAPVASNIARAYLVSSGQMLKDVCNYPNPAPSGEHPDSTIFTYYVAEDADVHISIYNIIGQLVDEIRHDARGGVYNEVEWNISPVASGVYFYVVEVMVESGEDVYKKGKLAVIK
ncbi:FG-GAP-like repeat-containing protein, partial [Candidatus Poribacteria bacterium]